MSNLALRMRQPIAHYISDLLYLHDCVIIPKFGGFVGNKKSAYIHPISGIIYPPSKAVLFNKNLSQNDGLLVTYISKKEEIDLSEATSLIDKFVQKIKTGLAEKSMFKIEKIGTLSRGKEGNISFMQNNIYNYNLIAFGMQPNHKNKKVERSIINKKKAAVKVIQQKDFRQTLMRAAAIFIPLVGLSLIGITQEEKVKNIYSQMANLNPFSNTIKNEVLNKISKVNVETPIVKIAAETETKISLPIVIEQHRYYIIAGAFAEQRNATNLCEKLKHRNLLIFLHLSCL